MVSPNLDPNKSPFQSTGSDDRLSDRVPSEQEAGITRPMPVTSSAESTQDDRHLQPDSLTQQPSAGQQYLDATQPSNTRDEYLTPPPDIPDEPVEAPKPSRRWILWAGLAVLLLALIAAGSAYAGYNSAIDQRTRYQTTLVAGEAANQYILAQQDIALGNYDRARQRLEYIIQIDSNYPNVSDQLAYVLTQQRITATPTLEPTPTLTPTPDYRGRDDLFTQAQSLLVGRDWTGAIDTLLLLRKNYPDYMAVQVDDMLFVALRNRGIDKIAQQHDLEGGNYDLTLAERFGPLDAEANNWREWADLYIRGASYWDVDWAQAVYYFSQVADAVPNLSDSSGWTASRRYMDALLGYGDWLAAQAKWCDAQMQYDTYMSLLADPQVEPTAAYAADKCNQASAVPAPTASETPTPGGETPMPATDTPSPTDTQQPPTTPYP
jgi:tetratricopeptide (TPR) repeat protein